MKKDFFFSKVLEKFLYEVFSGNVLLFFEIILRINKRGMEKRKEFFFYI